MDVQDKNAQPKSCVACASAYGDKLHDQDTSPETGLERIYDEKGSGL
jgi:hypothetical protein